MNQPELFQVAADNQSRFDTLIANVRESATKIAKEMEFPEQTLGIVENVTKSETNFPLQIRERRRSAPAGTGSEDQTIETETKDGVRLNFVCTNIATLVLAKPRSPNAGCVFLRVSSEVNKIVPPPEGAIVKERVVDGVVAKYEVIIPLGSQKLLPYLERIMRESLSRYRSTEPSFGCCHLYEECSNSRHCISKDKMYATACSYRRNLESGRIFYGKNKNA